MEIDIKPLSPALLEDYFSFFESVEFCEHPDWSDCYCYSFHFTGTAEQWNREKNRSAVTQLVGEHRMKGYLAYLEGRAVGWCNTNNRRNYQRLSKLYDLVDPDNPKICSIVCFVIHHDFRRMGISQQILHRIIKDCKARDFDIIEAYPGKGERSCEGHYMGPLDLYLRNGFKVEREYDDNILVRKVLVTN